MKLYYAPGACSLASHIALVDEGIEHERVRVDLKEHKTETGEDFYAINPRGYVPALDTGRFGLLTENPAVLLYIASLGASPPEGEALYRILEWIGFVGTEIHANFRPCFGNAGEAEKADAAGRLTGRYGLAAEALKERDWLVGERPTVADNYLFVTTLWVDHFGIALPPALQDFRRRNLERAAVRQAMQEEGLT